jgi:Uracil DNA glycosylase superfamily
MMKPVEFVRQLSAVRFEHTFNPYTDQCAVHDLPDAAQKRATALTAILDAACTVEIDSLWIGRDLGYRGGRRTGLALTDDAHLSDHAHRWNVTLERQTKGAAVVERTASVIWGMLNLITPPVFLWNVFPFHPYEHGNEFTNRAHNVRERRIGEEILEQMISLLKPKRLIALGNDAEKSLRPYFGNHQIVKVRHPSYGGQNEFTRQISDLYSINNRLLL